MIDFSVLKLVPAAVSHREFSYQLTNTAYRAYIEEIWGWDEKGIREFHTRNWENKRPSIILYDNEPIGTIYVKEEKEYIEIEQFIISPGYQNQGIGTHIMKDIMDRADRTGRVIKLNYLRMNPVASLYSRLGFEIVADDDPFIWVERKPGG